jgi:predicted nucleic acid-binding protein
MTLVFIDTNVLIYNEDGSNQEKRDIAHQWLLQLWERGTGRLSSQVLNEFYVNVTKKLKPPMPQVLAREEVQRYAVWQPWAIDHTTIESAFTVESRYGLSYWDSLVIASAQHMGCQYVLSEDMAHGQTYGALQVINPFIASITLLDD